MSPRPGKDTARLHTPELRAYQKKGATPTHPPGTVACVNRYVDAQSKAEQAGISVTALCQLANVNADEVLYSYRDTPAATWDAILTTCTWIDRVKAELKDQSFQQWYTTSIAPGVKAGALLAYRKDLLEKVLTGQLTLTQAGKAGWGKKTHTRDATEKTGPARTKSTNKTAKKVVKKAAPKDPQ